jgi:hypothetical protein
MSGSRVTKADLIRIARALGDDRADELGDETVSTIFARCIERAEQLSAPASIYPLEHAEAHPVVRDWCRRVIDAAVDQVLSCRMGENEGERFAAQWVDSSVRKHAALDPATCTHTMRAGRCLRCGLSTVVHEAIGLSEAIDLMHRNPLPPLALREDRSPEQLQADGDAPMAARCKACGRLLEESDYPDCPTCGAQISLDDFEPDCIAEYDRPAPEPCDEDGAPLDMTPKPIADCGEAVPVLVMGNELQPVGVAHREGDAFVMSLASGERVAFVLRADERRENAEQWAKTMGSKGGATNA